MPALMVRSGGDLPVVLKEGSGEDLADVVVLVAEGLREGADECG